MDLQRRKDESGGAWSERLEKLRARDGLDNDLALALQDARNAEREEEEAQRQAELEAQRLTPAVRSMALYCLGLPGRATDTEIRQALDTAGLCPACAVRLAKRLFPDD